jgi:hypothetical protein
MRVSLDGKFICIIEIPKHCVGNSEKIFNQIKEKRPKDIKKIDLFVGRTSVKDFVKAIALQDKPVVNFITK